MTETNKEGPCPYCGSGPCLEPMPMVPGTTARQHPGCYALKRDTEASAPQGHRATHSDMELVRSVDADAVPPLRLCPFCGSDARVIEFEDCAVAQCLDMKAHRLIVDGDNTAAHQVAALWNERAP